MNLLKNSSLTFLSPGERNANLTAKFVKAPENIQRSTSSTPTTGGSEPALISSLSSEVNDTSTSGSVASIAQGLLESLPTPTGPQSTETQSTDPNKIQDKKSPVTQKEDRPRTGLKSARTSETSSGNKTQGKGN